MNTAIILAGGRGTRLGSDIPKQYIEVEGKPVISYCLDVFFLHHMIDAVQIVADKMWHEYIMSYVDNSKFSGFSTPGETRQLSILNGLADISNSSSCDDNVIIHDAARPFVTHQMITECLQSCDEHDGAIPVLPMKDTVYMSDNGQCISKLIERNKLFAGQAPEAFRFGKYFEANKKLLPDEILKINGSTEPAVIMGMDICMIKGDENNFKITTKSDLDRFKEIIK